jgi:hypothetical protein
MKSLINAVLLDTGDEPISEIASIRPIISLADSPADIFFRIDVEAKTGQGEAVAVEVVMCQFPRLFAGALLGILFWSKAIEFSAPPADAKAEAAAPRVIEINFVNFELNDHDVRGFHQVGVMSFREPGQEPREEAAGERLTVHNIDLPKFRRLSGSNLGSPLRRWAATLCRGLDEGKALKEVVALEPALREFYDEDEGFRQFIDRYEEAAADLDIREEHDRWLTAIGGGHGH